MLTVGDVNTSEIGCLLELCSRAVLIHESVKTVDIMKLPNDR